MAKDLKQYLDTIERENPDRLLRIKSSNGENFNFDAPLSDFISKSEPKPHIAKMHAIQRLTQRKRKRK